ncbi:MAG TPA: sigma-70 family RNA polymerase sigma factor [Solirubrobacterales bacterium]|nr:sigma-70 family RNA polymerase sigma factor [Solirubrobacterales bacterium]
MPRGDPNREREVREAYAAHSTELYGLAIRFLGDPELAEEAVQQTFLLAWKADDHFDPEVGSLRSRLFATLRGVVLDLGSAQAARSPVAEGGVEATVERLEQSFLAWQVEEAMRRIGKQHRQILVETFYRGRSYAEVGAELGLPQDTVESRVNDGLRALKVALSELAIEGCEPRD